VLVVLVHVFEKVVIVRTVASCSFVALLGVNDNMMILLITVSIPVSIEQNCNCKLTMILSKSKHDFIYSYLLSY